jgi:hypothetical protein
MNRPAITYDVEAFCDVDQRLHVEIAWNDHRKQFMLDITRGTERNKRRWFDENLELDAILRNVASLQVPLGIDGPCGLDGVSFKLRIGHAPAVTFSWWMEIPEDWEPLQSIVNRINRIVEQEA